MSTKTAPKPQAPKTAKKISVPADVPETDAQVDVKLDAPAPRTGNAAQADDATREQVRQMMAELRNAGYTRPELSRFTGLADSPVWRAQNGLVHTVELDVWMPLFERFVKGELDPPAKSTRKPKVESLQAKIDAALAALADEAKTAAQYRKIVEAAREALRGV